MAVFMAGQKSRGLLRSQARMTQVCEEVGVGGEMLVLCLPTLLSPLNPPYCPCHNQQSSCCLGMTGRHPLFLHPWEGGLSLHPSSSLLRFLVLDTGDTQSAPTVTQTPPADLHPVCYLPAHQPKPPCRLTTEGQRRNPGGPGTSFTSHWKARNQTVHGLLIYSTTVLL